jgi:MoxR-like ATPase
MTETTETTEKTLPEAENNDLASSWLSLISEYKSKLNKQLTKLVDESSEKPVAELKITSNSVTEVYLKQIGVSKRGNLSFIALQFKPSGKPSGSNPVTVRVDVELISGASKMVQGVEFSPLVARISLPLALSNNVQNNVSQLLDPGDFQVTWRGEDNVLTWGTRGVPDLPLYAQKWFLPRKGEAFPAMRFVGSLEGTNLSLKGRAFQVICPDIEVAEAVLPLPLEPESLEKVAKVHAMALVARAIDWVVFATFVQGVSFDVQQTGENIHGDQKDPAVLLGLIKSDDYNPNPTRPVDLSPFELKEIAEGKKLYFSWNVYQTICTSLNLGRHLILTGPPGCGKSELATLVARLIGDKSGREGATAEPKVVTASPSWTSGDLIGRYFPYPPDGILRFQPGIFLQALEEDRCLVIDEMNRANLDECFGELFTVLAGHAVDLPYQQSSRDSENNLNDESNLKTVRIVPRKGGSIVPPDRVLYTMSQTFRLIGTMNDADRSLLHQLSFALLRRFDVVRIDPPSNEDLKRLLDNRLPQRGQLEIYRFQATNMLTAVPQLARDRIEELMANLFFNDRKQGLIPAYVVGVATLLDVLGFVLEGLRPNSANQNIVQVAAVNGNNQRQKISDFVTSLTTLALILTVVPQLDALNGDQFKITVEHLKECLGEGVYLRLNLDGSNLELVQEGDKTASTFLLQEIKRATRGTQHADIVDELRSEDAPGE